MPLGNLGPMAIQASNARTNFLFGMEQLNNQIKQAKLNRLFQMISQQLQFKQQDKMQKKGRDQQLMKSGISAASMMLLMPPGASPGGGVPGAVSGGGGTAPMRPFQSVGMM